MIAGDHGGRRLAAGQECADRHSVAQGLCRGHHVRFYAVSLPGEHLPGAPHSALNLIQHQQGIMVVAQLPHPLDECVRRRIDAALPLDGLHQHGAGLFVKQRLDALQIVKFCKLDIGDQRRKRLLVVVVARHGQRPQAPSVKGMLHGDDLIIRCHSLIVCITLCNL